MMACLSLAAGSDFARTKISTYADGWWCDSSINLFTVKIQQGAPQTSNAKVSFTNMDMYETSASLKIQEIQEDPSYQQALKSKLGFSCTKSDNMIFLKFLKFQGSKLSSQLSDTTSCAHPLKVVVTFFLVQNEVGWSYNYRRMELGRANPSINWS